MVGDELAESAVGHDSQFEQNVPAFRAALEWIEKLLGIRITHKENFRSVLSSGEILCNLLNVIVPGGIRRVNHCPNRASAMDNLSLFLTACEEKCGIPRSKLFSVDDFEDIFDRKLEAGSVDEKCAKRSVKVVVSLLWLAKYADHTPKCNHLPRLDYEAFLGLLSKTFVRSSALFSTGDSFSSERKSSQLLEEVSQRPIPSEKPAQQKAHVYFSGGLGSDYSVKEVCLSGSMGNLVSAAPSPTIVLNEAVHRSTPPPCEPPTEKQINNNGVEEDEWQANLLDWCEKRRKFSRMHATKMMTFEEVQQEEELKRQEAAKDRMRQIKAQRNLGTEQCFPSSGLLNQIPPSSPGMALLIGGGSEFFNSPDDLLSEESKGADKNSSLADQLSMASDTPDAVVSVETLADTPLSGFHGSISNFQSSAGFAHMDAEVKTANQMNYEDAYKSESVTPNIVSPVMDQGPASEAENHLRELRICIQSNSKSVEPRWGMSIRAEGPSLTAPFVVDRVKIGSTADVCEITKGDVLLELNGIDLRQNPSVLETYTLQELEHLMDQCSLSSKPIDLRLLRCKSQNDDLSDCDLDNDAVIADLDGKRALLDSPAYNSDVDNHESQGKVLVVNRDLLPSDRMSPQVLKDRQPISSIQIVTSKSNGGVNPEPPRCSSNSSTEVQRWTLDLPLKKPLNAQI